MALRRFRQETNGNSNLVALVTEEDDKDWTEDHIFLNKEGGYLSVEARRDLDKVLGWLTPDHRRMLEMFYLEDVSYPNIPTVSLPSISATHKDIADQFGLKVGDIGGKLR